jgi:hypothetical protein
LVLDLATTFEKKPTKSLEHLIWTNIGIDLATISEKKLAKSLEPLIWTSIGS